MATSPIFPRTRARRGMYESFYLRAVAPAQPIGIWIRQTVHKPPGERASGSVWCTVFDAHRGRPFMHKLTSAALTVPLGGWIAVGETATSDARRSEPHGEHEPRASAAPPGGSAWMGNGRAEGSCGAAEWTLRFSSRERELRHLPHVWLYRAPLPRTKLTSPAPDARFDGALRLDGEDALELVGWRGMVGHNWGSEHAERWIWLHGVGFEEDPEAWLDVALGRLRFGGRMTPWIANGALSIGGRRFRVGGLLARGLHVAESVTECDLRLPGERGLVLDARVEVPAASAAVWRYADPDASAEHDVVNCSIAAVSLTVTLPGEARQRTLHTAHGGAYELGTTERGHGAPAAG